MNDHTPFENDPAGDIPLSDDQSDHDLDHDAFAADLQASFRADPTPGHRDGFWTSLDDELEFEIGSRPVGVVDVHHTGSDPDHSYGTGGTVSQIGDLAEHRRQHSGRRSVMSVIGAVAACFGLVIGGLVLARMADDDGATIVASPAGQGAGTGQEAGTGRADLQPNPLFSLPNDMASTDLDPVFTVRSRSLNVFYHRLTSLSTLSADGVWRSNADYVLSPEALEGQGGDLSGVPADQAEPDFGGDVAGVPEDLGDLVMGPSAPGQDQASYTLSESECCLPWLPVPSSTFWVGAIAEGSLLFSVDSEAWLVHSDSEPITDYTASFNAPQTFGSLAMPDVPEFAGEAVAAAELELPGEIRGQVEALASSLTSEAQSDFERAATLETYFRTEFTLDPQANSVTSRPFAELLDRRTGHPEHFAGTFAAMMRSLGVPARVVVGFLPGERVDGEPDLQIVRQRDAHAWAEVRLNGRWVRFDPTPGRGVSTGSPDLPMANRDHWHAPYAFYDCRSGNYLAKSLSQLDPLGIHSHQDGVIHIHPFFEASAGKNATFGIFLDSIEATLDGSGLSTLEGSLPASATCDGEEAVLHLRKWDFDFMMDTGSPEIVVDGIDSVRFENDREVYLLALAPVDGDLPPFPTDRLQTLYDVAGAITPNN